jgi:hypothetical protein
MALLTEMISYWYNVSVISPYRSTGYSGMFSTGLFSTLKARIMP